MESMQYVRLVVCYRLDEARICIKAMTCQIPSLGQSLHCSVLWRSVCTTPFQQIPTLLGPRYRRCTDNIMHNFSFEPICSQDPQSIHGLCSLCISIVNTNVPSMLRVVRRAHKINYGRTKIFLLKLFLHIFHTHRYKNR